MSERPSRDSRPLDAQSLSLLLDIELACAFILRFSTVPPFEGLQHGVQPHGALDEILQRIAVALARLARADNGARNLLSRGEQDTIKVLVKGGARAATKDAARRVLLAAVPRLLFETQALLAENREPWVAGNREPSGAGRLRGFPIAS
jgi:hypothetical protein